MPSKTLELVVAGCLAACAPAASQIAPAPRPPAHAPAPKTAAVDATPEVAPGAAENEAVAISLPVPEAPSEPQPSIVFEPPYKLGNEPQPKTQEEYKRDILDRRHWNGGGLGELLGELPGVEGHPDPRVIVNVASIQGAHDKTKIEVFARKYHWIEVVRCYRLGAYKDRELRGWIKVRLDVAGSGKATGAKLLESDLASEEVARCMAERLEAHAFPKAEKGSRVIFAMRVGPGDEPMPPPDDLILPGDGELSSEEMTSGVAAGRAAFEACYRSALAYAPGLWGRMILRFHLTERGQLDEVFQVNRRFPDPRMSQCVAHAARKLSFPRPRGGEMRFVVALRFSSDRADTSAPSEGVK